MKPGIYWTDYPFTELGDEAGKPAPWREVEVIAYDGDKYATVRLPDGSITEVKSGYLHESLEALMKAQP